MRALTWRGETARARTTPSRRSRPTCRAGRRVAREADRDDLARTTTRPWRPTSTARSSPSTQLNAAIRRATIAGKVNPVVTGSAFKNKGVQPMLDAVVEYLPSPLDIGAIEGTLTDGETPAERQPDPKRATSPALAFKVATDPHLGKLTFVRVYSGTLNTGTQVVNATKDRKERIGKIYQMHANKREELASVSAGDIVAVMGLKQTTTGDTLSDPAQPDRPRVDERSRIRSSRSRSSRRPRATRRSWAPRSRSSPKRTRRSRSRTTRRPARRSSPAWASCTWTSWSSGCGGSSTSRPTSASRRWRTARPSAARSRSTATSTRSRPVDPGSTRRS